jgi:hypothetical protein
MSERETDLTTDELASAGRGRAHDDRDVDDRDVDDRDVDDRAAREMPGPVTTEDATAVAGQGAPTEPLLATDDAQDFRGRWEQIQHRFVDEPQKAVENADGLVAELMQHLAQLFAQEREGLERQWSRGEQASTEDLRVALQRYRNFFQRLLST